MNNSIIFITKSLHHVANFNDVIKTLEMEIPTFYDSDPDKCLEIAKEEVRKGAKVIISTRLLCNLFAQYIQIPLVPIKRSSYTFVLCLEEAFNSFDKIALLSKRNDKNSVEQTFQTAVLEAHNLYPQKTSIFYLNELELEETIINIKNEGFKAVVCPAWAVDVVEKYSLKAILVNLPKRDVIEAINQAKHNLEIYKKKIENENLITTILNIITQGIVAFDNAGKILHVNDATLQIFSLNKTDIIGKSYLETVLIPLDILNAIASKNPVQGKIITVNGIMLIVNYSPIIVDNQVSMLIITLNKAEDVQETEQKIRTKLLSSGNHATKTFQSIVGASRIMSEKISMAKRFAQVDSTILITAPSGSGKEVFAQSIHNASSRRNKPFVVINCAALPESILESLLFGYEKGSFTGANNSKPGLFEIAHEGTVFLDEISEMPLSVQARFLRVLQEKEVMKLGSDKVIPIDIRVIAATNKNINDLIVKELFREDLYFRISVLLLEIPPLSERIEDIAPLAKNFLLKRSIELGLKIRSFTDEALHYLSTLSFPGNVRQLNNIVERAIVLSTTDQIDIEIMKQVSKGMKALENNTDIQTVDFSLSQQVLASEATAILQILNEFEGNRTKAASKLGISTSTLWRKMKSLNII